jgi:hypothetical protein
LLVATSISVESNHSEINNNDESSLSDLHEALVGYIGDALADHPAASVANVAYRHVTIIIGSLDMIQVRISQPRRTESTP